MLVKGCQDRVYNGTIDCAHAAIKLTHKVKKVKSVSKMANKAVMKILKKIGSKTRKILHVKLKINKVNKVIRKIAKINVHSSIHKTLKKIGGHTRKELRKLAEHAIRNAHALKAHVLYKQALDKVADSIVHGSDKPKAIKHKVGESRGLVRLPMLRKKTKFNFVKKLGKAIH